MSFFSFVGGPQADEEAVKSTHEAVRESAAASVALLVAVNAFLVNQTPGAKEALPRHSKVGLVGMLMFSGVLIIGDYIAKKFQTKTRVRWNT